MQGKMIVGVIVIQKRAKTLGRSQILMDRPVDARMDKKETRHLLA